MIRSILWIAGIVLLTCVQLDVSAQTAIARFKYEEAEEAFSKDDFRTCLEKLRETEKLVGAVNPKIMFLRIAAEYKLLTSAPIPDLTMAADLREHVDFYMKQYETNENIEEKFREVYKISEAIKKYGNHSALLKAARKGDVKAMVKFAVLNSRRGNYAAAREWYEQAAEKGSAAAVTGIGSLYDFGLNAPPDFKQAFNWYTRAAGMDDALGTYALGSLYYNGQGVAKDEERAKELLQQALPGLEKQTENKDDPFAAEALTAIASLYYVGIPMKRDSLRALQMYEQAAAMGDNEAMYLAGLCYVNMENGLPPDHKKGFTYFRRAAENGYPKAMRAVGMLYYEGTGVEKDQQKAWEWMIKAAQCHDVSAMSSVGALYYNGHGVKQDYAQAVVWYRKAAEAGHVDAMVILGNMYRDATGVERNYGTAREYYEKAVAANDDVDALRHLGDLYHRYNGYGNAVNYTKALEYFKRAADKGDKHSMQMIGNMYMTGTGVKKDKKLGRAWMAKSFGKGGAMQLLQTVAGDTNGK